MIEVWKAIDSFDRYEVSNLGRVRNLGGSVVAAGNLGGVRTVPARLLKPFIASKTGYMQVLLPDRRKHSVHRLVARAFCSGYADGLVVDHINNDRSDNRAENLRWLSTSENIARPYRENGLAGAATGKFSDQAMKTTAIVASCIKTGATMEFACASDAVRMLRFDSGSISKCCTGKQASHHGWTFRFADGVSGFPYKKNRASLQEPLMSEAA